MDGFENSEGIIVIGATNQQDKMDEALLRPGRFDWKIEANLPDAEEWAVIFKLKLESRKNKITDEEIKWCAELSQFLSGSEIEVIVNEAASSAIWESMGEHTVFLQDTHLNAATVKAVEEKKKFIQN